MKIHILTENKVKATGLLAEHGLSVFIEYKDLNILFDTGQTNVYSRNAVRMGLDLNKTDFIVLSHGHYDHTGGLPFFPVVGNLPTIYVHKDAVKRKYLLGKDNNICREVGIPWSVENIASLKGRIVLTGAKTVLQDDITLIAEIPDTTGFEGVPAELCVESGGKIIPDVMKDEQMLVIDTDKGLCVFLGCSHPGVVNCLKQALAIFPGKRIYSLLAGMHLDFAPPEQLEKTIGAIAQLDIEHIFPLHCTGLYPIFEMKRRLGDRCEAPSTGDTIEI